MGEKCNKERDAKRSARRIKIICDMKCMQAKTLAGIAVLRRQPNIRRVVMLVLCGMKLVLVSAKDSTVCKQSAVRVFDTLIQICALKNCMIQGRSDGQCKVKNS